MDFKVEKTTRFTEIGQSSGGIMERNAKIEMTTSPDDWHVIRECYVHSFRRYPLYKYMVPDDSKRDDFLRAYLDANYEVTVGSGQGILLGMWIRPDLVNDNCSNCSQIEEASNVYKLVGGVLIVPPADNGCGWAIGSDEPYWEAYEKHGLAEISKEGLERVKRYEAWENVNVSQRVARTRIPMWNGLFCAMLPEYTSKGLGTFVYKEALGIIARHWIKRQPANKSRPAVDPSRLNFHAPSKDPPSATNPDSNSSLMSRVKDFSLKQLHCYALLSHRPIPHELLAQRHEQNPKGSPQNTAAAPKKPGHKLTEHKSPAPLLVAISHSEKAAHFHESNGFQKVSRIPFHDAVEDSTPFYTHVLVLDPFRTGRIKEFDSALASSVSFRQSQSCTNDFVIIE